MGEAKRRKKLDPNYGRKSKSSMGDIAWHLYLKYGRGVLALNRNGYLGYCSPLMFDDIEQSQINDYNPAFQFCFCREIDSEKYGILKMFAVSRRNDGFGMMEVSASELDDSFEKIPVFGFDYENKGD